MSKIVNNSIRTILTVTNDKMFIRRVKEIVGKLDVEVVHGDPTHPDI